MSLGNVSNLGRVLDSGSFAVTVEIGPPRGPDIEALKRKINLLKGVADAYNVTDNQTAVVRMSSIAASKIILDAGLEPVMQMTCRDRNRIALQSDLIGASALGIRNCLCLSGDHQSAGASGKLKGHAGSKNVFDIDSIQLVSVLKGLRDDAKQESGDAVTHPTPFLIGAAWTPLAPPVSFRTIRLAKKINAGADFIQTQAVYDITKFKEAVARARDMGLTDRAAILPGIIVPRSAMMLEYMHKNVPGVDVPEAIIKRMAAAPKENRVAIGIDIAVELIARVIEIPGIRGVHVQAIEAEEVLPEVIKRAGLLPRP
ncbi:MAG: methylenetetrahydrofolate reductase [Deltaproteobacteria bacterium]|nr:methylenetetrahydrofolate reductase [Deltaproteobacteria bacterium]